MGRYRSIYYIRAVSTHLGGPLSRLPRFETGFAVHGVDHLQRDPRRLVQEKVGKDGRGEVATGKDETVAIVDLSGDEGGEERLRRRARISNRSIGDGAGGGYCAHDQKVPQPVRSGAQCSLTGSLRDTKERRGSAPDSMLARSCSHSHSRSFESRSLRSRSKSPAPRSRRTKR